MKNKIIKTLAMVLLSGGILFGSSKVYNGYTVLEEEKTALTKELNTAKATNGELKDILDKTENTLNETKESLEKTSKEKKNGENKVKELNKKIASLEEELSFKRAAREEAERLAAEEQAKASAAQAQIVENNTPKQEPSYVAPVPVSSGGLQFGSDGLLVMSGTSAAQNVINLLLGIPGHANGAAYHQSTGLDAAIDALSIPEAVYVAYRIEGPGFGQTGDGYAGIDSSASHQAFVQNQVNNRFGGDIKYLLKKWGTYSYGGY